MNILVCVEKSIVQLVGSIPGQDVGCISLLLSPPFQVWLRLVISSFIDIFVSDFQRANDAKDGLLESVLNLRQHRRQRVRF